MIKKSSNSRAFQIDNRFILHFFSDEPELRP